jgi:hypothetical protein
MSICQINEKRKKERILEEAVANGGGMGGGLALRVLERWWSTQDERGMGN